MRSLGLSAFIGLVCVSPVLAQSGEAPRVEISMQVADQAPVTWPLPNASPEGDAFDFDGARTQSTWGMTWDLTVKPDPWIVGVIGITNSSAFTQTYTVTLSMPVFPTLASPTLSGGSVGATLTDDGSAFAQMAAVGGGAMYMGMIDGVGVLPLLPPAVGSLTVVSAGQTATASANAMPPSLPTGAVNSTIGIQYRFTLSPNDIAAFTGRFEVIPEPATLLLLSFSGLMLFGRGRRI